MRHLALVLWLLCLAPAVALAQGSAEQPFPDEDYVGRYFGVELHIIMQEQIPYGAESWWADQLPPELLDSNYAAGVVNAQRSANKIAPLLNTTDYFISPTNEEQVDNGWQYTMEFTGLRPSEIKLLLDTLGGADKVFPGGALTYMPLLARSFNTWSEEPGVPLTLDINGHELTVKYGESLDSIRERASKLFAEVYGQEAMLEITMGQYSYSDGSGGSDFSIYAQLPAG
jgi:hypothetical protein